MDAIAVLCKRLCIRVRFGRLRHAALSSRHGSQNSFQRLPVPVSATRRWLLFFLPFYPSSTSSGDTSFINLSTSIPLALAPGP